MTGSRELSLLPFTPRTGRVIVKHRVNDKADTSRYIYSSKHFIIKKNPATGCSYRDARYASCRRQEQHGYTPCACPQGASQLSCTGERLQGWPSTTPRTSGPQPASCHVGPSLVLNVTLANVTTNVGPCPCCTHLNVGLNRACDVKLFLVL